MIPAPQHLLRRDQTPEVPFRTRKAGRRRDRSNRFAEIRPCEAATRAATTSVTDS